MTNTVTKKAAPVVHFEIGCRNSEATSEFYRSVFSWSINQMGPASMIQGAEQGIAGHITSLGHEPHNYVTVYIQVERIEDYLDEIEGYDRDLILCQKCDLIGTVFGGTRSAL